MERLKLKAARYSRGWSQEEVAAQVGVSRNIYGLWEQGKVTP